MSPRHKRKIGGQPGNQNARTHGFYSKAVTAGQLKQFHRAKQVVGLDQEIAMLRVKIKDILANSPDSSSTLLKAVNALARLIQLKHESPVKKTNERVLRRYETDRTSAQKKL